MPVIDYDEIRNKPPSDMQIAECILVISRNVGLNHSYRAAFGLRALNSIHAYLTGEWYFPKEDYRTPQSPEQYEIREAIAENIGISYEPGPNKNRTFTLEGYREIANAIKSTNDQRPKP